MRITIAEKLYIEDATKECMDWCKKNLTFPNPDYYKKERLGKWTGNTPKEIALYERMGLDIYIPFGCYTNFFKAFPNTPYKAVFCPVRHFNYHSDINLYDYQERAVKAVLERKNGIVVAPCGGGKTVLGLEAVARIGGRALWLTHTQDLLNQSMSKAISLFNAPLDSYGKITEGKVNVGEGITFATIQTLSKLDLRQYKNYWDVVIVDECHKAAGSPTRVTQFYKALSNLQARYKIGLTATPKRADGLEVSMFALLGDQIIEITRQDVADTTCEIRVMTMHTEYKPDYNVVLMGDGTINYAKLVDDMIQDNERFEVISKVINAIDGPTIVLANRVEYLKQLTEACNLRAVCLSGNGQSKKAKEERKEALEKLNNGDLDVVFASYQLAKEGLDVPNLRYVMFATPERDESTVIQAAGRVGRKAEGKEYGTVVDFLDDWGMFRSWAKKRQGYYRKIQDDIKIDEVW